VGALIFFAGLGLTLLAVNSDWPGAWVAVGFFAAVAGYTFENYGRST